MKFRFPLLNGLVDAQQNFEQLEGLDILDETAESFLAVPSTATPTRALNTVYQPSTSRPVLTTISINLANAAGQTGLVQVLSDTANPPTTERARVFNGTASTQIQAPVTVMVPATHFVKLVTTGTGTIGIVETAEWTL